jgi:DNA-damage-inducible protein J
MVESMQIQIDSDIKNKADKLFESLGLDMSTAFRMFIVASLNADGLPFPVKNQKVAKSVNSRIADWEEIERMIKESGDEELPDFPRVNFGRELVTF